MARQQEASLTTRFERLLLMIVPVLLPLENHLPTGLSEISSLRLIFALLAGYLLLNRPTWLARTCYHRAFLAAYVFLAISILIELFHPTPSFYELFRIAQMIGGAVLLASLCRDRGAGRAMVYGYIISAVWLSLVLTLTMYADLEGVAAATRSDADRARGEAAQDIPFEASLNGIAYLCTLGGVAALGLMLAARSTRRRWLLLLLYIVCMVGVFLAMSRGGILNFVASSSVVLYASRLNVAKRIIPVLAIAVSALVLVPDVVWKRLTFSMDPEEDARGKVYSAAIEHFPEYALGGVGAGNFWSSWGPNSSFGRQGGTKASGAHNVYIQVAIYWGLLALLALFAVLWCLYYCIPKARQGDDLALCLYGLGTSTFIISFFSHNLEAKVFSLGIGLVVAADNWRWAEAVVQHATRFRGQISRVRSRLLAVTMGARERWRPMS